MLRVIADAAKEKGADVEMILLREADIAWCDGCLTCEDQHGCHIKDNMQELYASIENCDALVLGTPVHFDGVSPQLKNVISRLNPFCDGRLKGKRIAFAAVGQLSGDKGVDSRRRVTEYLRDVATI
jgi:multimeric flavodoxin WrbA